MPNNKPYEVEQDIIKLLKGGKIQRKKERSVYDFNVVNANGVNESLSRYKGKTLLILNVYERCKWSTQIRDLKQLHEKYQKYGFEIIAFLCDQFEDEENFDYGAMSDKQIVRWHS